MENLAHQWLPSLSIPAWLGYALVALLFAKYLFFYLLQRKGQTDPSFVQRLHRYFAQEQIHEGRRYSMRHRNLSLLDSLITYPLLGLFVFAGWSAMLESWSQSLTGHWFAALVLYLAVVLFAITLLSLPLSYYQNFIIEKEEGFNKQTIGLWLWDMVKANVIQIILLTLLLAILIQIIELFPKFWWLLGAAAVALFSLALTYIAPIWIMPLFNKFTNLEDKELHQKIMELSETAGINIKNIFVMDASRRSSHSNAFFAGISKSKRVVLFDTLLQSHSHEEIISILAHELGHWRKGHVRKGLFLSIVATFVGFILLYILFHWQPLRDWFHIQNLASVTFFVAAMFVMQISALIITPISSYFSRKHEREADAEALKLYPNGQAQAETMRKLVLHNKSDLLGHPWVQAYSASHPHPLERIEFAHSHGTQIS